MEIIVKILNEQGLHARPASIFVKTANKFKSTISILHGDEVANAKSIINIMSLGLSKNEEIKRIRKYYVRKRNERSRHCEHTYFT